ncbi:hypothetical protein NQ176_g2636 [Zarea fungicola]|uniref:Uncharacterized protein n=1 Tax=Zarea fungicola TaxID=93591 RepID=A0ACC1NPD3_9HYPO|nr:hypothetical protein NQ176_g2636 [Lecanicillium fungicola]
MFMEAGMVGSAKVAPEKRDVGVWIPSGVYNNSGKESQLRTPRPPSIVDSCLIPFVREHCLTALPFEDDFMRMKAVYKKKIHPIFPAIPLSALEGSLQESSNVVLRQLVCLAAAADPDVCLHLRLKNKGSNILSPQEYSEALSSSIRATLETSLITDRLLHIRILTVLSLYAQPKCADDIDLPVQLNGWAIHHLHTLGLHHAYNAASNSDEMETLLCCVWALDRINAAVHGCPCVMHERDMGADLESCIRKQPSCFRLLLSVVKWLDRVIDLYRPGPSATTANPKNDIYVDLPDFETMVVDADAFGVSVPLLATVEVFYHAVVILSNRKPRTVHIPTTPNQTTHPTGSARQSLAAERIACSVARDHLSPIQLIPYAASLALSVEYRVMRQSVTPLSRARAMYFFKRHCEMLQKYRNHFWGANIVATLAESIIGEVEKAAATGSTRGATPGPCNREGTTTEPVQNDTAQNQEIRTLAQQQERRDAELSRDSQNWPVPDQVIAGFDAPIASTSRGIMDSTDDLSFLTSGLDDGFFGHIDTLFNLDAVDADTMGMEAYMPFNWRDWQQYAQ